MDQSEPLGFVLLSQHVEMFGTFYSAFGEGGGVKGNVESLDCVKMRANNFCTILLLKLTMNVSLGGFSGWEWSMASSSPLSLPYCYLKSNELPRPVGFAFLP